MIAQEENLGAVVWGEATESKHSLAAISQMWIR